MIGRTFSHYRVTDKLGGGGMGVVYKAEDTRLGRAVALKFLPEGLASEPQALERFQREARAASALNHSGICTVYDIDSHDGQWFIAMEHLDGQTLRERISGRPVDLLALLDLGIQIADALEAAHAKGVVHRDLKPANVWVTPRGQTKILDFGLAKLSHQGKTSDSSERPTEAPPELTTAGSVLGTVAYMSPEQVRGEPLDARTDLFSLGIVLYEMATGRQAFSGTTTGVVFDGILNRDPPPPSESNPAVPQELDRIIAKALEKDRDLRCQSAAELRSDLKRLKRETTSGRSVAARANSEKLRSAQPDESGSVTPGVSEGAATSKRRLWPLALAAMAVLILLTSGLLWFRRPQRASEGPTQLVPFASLPGFKSSPAFSPDGNAIAFSWDGGHQGHSSIYVELVGAGTPLQLTKGSGDDSYPAWSPDGRHIAFVRDAPEGSGYFLVPSLGGAERRLSPSYELGGPDWSPDGKLLAVVDRTSRQGPLSLLLISVESGEQRELPTGTNEWLASPAFSPDGRSIAFAAGPEFLAADVFVMPAGGGDPKRLTFDRLSLLGGLAWAPDGRDIIFSSGRAGGISRLWRVPVSGGPPELVSGAGEDAQEPSVSRKGSRLAYVHVKVDTNIWRIPGPTSASRSGTPVRLISSTRGDVQPQYSPDGKRVTFSSDRSGTDEIYVSQSDGSSPIQLTSLRSGAGTPRWSPDGQSIVFDARAKGQADIYVISAQGGEPRALTSGPSSSFVPSWSRDGRWVYFTSNRSGSEQLWKVPAKGGEAVQVTQHGGRDADELPDGASLYYVREGAVWMMPRGGGEETRVADRAVWGEWASWDRGLCFMDETAMEGPTVSCAGLSGHPLRRLATLEKGPSVGGAPGFDVSPDGQWIAFRRADSYDTDIMLLENFH